jgi:hypothetical protein
MCDKLCVYIYRYILSLLYIDFDARDGVHWGMDEMNHDTGKSARVSGKSGSM